MAGFPYEIYYFSRNMEHVLHDRAENLTDDEKEDLAFDIADQYTDQLEKFLEYLHDDGFYVWIVNENDLNNMYLNLNGDGAAYEFSDSMLKTGLVDIYQ